MSIFSDNIRFLRTQKNLSQQELADQISMSRVRYSKYEDGRSEAPYELLIRISKYFNLSIDLLLTVDIRKYPLEDVLKLPDNRILLPIKVDMEGNNVIEIVPAKASMGYLTGYSDPEYIESLQQIVFPFLSHGKYRAFPADGDSMPPHQDGAYVIGKYIESIADLKIGKSYIFVTRSEGITYKRLLEIEPEKITVKADNLFYQPYDIPLESIIEIWEYAMSIATKEFDPSTNNFDNQQIITMFQEIQGDLKIIKDSQ
ncbi:XRE family transcriptional regulator [Chryseobacterium geocarposphaerae]|uniref:Helix-turn-helix protein n=1 Tax=Chryseobacterium geocarposphaerae TaxID=1416776 RepID=A0A2M9C6E0_9FLAO|nr:LexA family transcriptional regulator [Chryseobacterium geocarposphaerae]PJJ66400.1 helix-turn-helix protein [Chryseobacterium geocarposphaerae]